MYVGSTTTVWDGKVQGISLVVERVGDRDTANGFTGSHQGNKESGKDAKSKDGNFKDGSRRD